ATAAASTATRHTTEQSDPTSTHAEQQVPAIDPYGYLVRDLPAIVYDKEDDTTFDTWYKRYGLVIEDRGLALIEERKRNLVIDKLGNAIDTKSYADHVLTLKPRDIDLATTIQKLTLLFGPKRTLTNRMSSIDTSASHQLVPALPSVWQHGEEKVRGDEGR
ncbi:unnamed protein product, partial [Heligmosomoides polygyrus]|uniref:mRNA_cap_enzyme domain-containing protein n=1 Tax=Heligmosomoides polygyrus TaxID=6339 RepID=A0A183GU47_HELPZ